MKLQTLQPNRQAKSPRRQNQFRYRLQRFGKPSRFRRLLHELLEDRSLLTASPLYLPPRHELFQQNGFLTAPTAGDPLQIALAYLNSHAGDLNLTTTDLADVKVTDDYVSEGTGVTNIYLRQTVAGLEVAYADLGIHLTALGEIINIAGGFVTGLSAQIDAGLISLTPAVSAEDAVRGAALELGLGQVIDISMIDMSEDGRSCTISAPSVSLDDIDARLHFVPTPDGSAALSWQLIVRTPDNQHWLDLSVDAHDSELLAQTDWTDNESYSVIPFPTESLNEGAFQVVTNPYLAATNASPFGWHDTDGVAGPEFTDTRGNNVDVHLDRDNNNVADTTSVTNSKGRPNGGPSLNFGTFTFNPALAPSVSQNQDAAMVNAFYWLNLLHDIHYQYGFTSAAGNFQTNVYGLGGIGNDAVQADSQDGANVGNVNNANFSTPPDGQAPRVQFFEYTSTSPRRDSAMDASLIVHEYGHGVSRRLTGGPANGSSLNALQSTGLNEGWSDWWSLMLLQQSASETTDGRAMSTYLRGQTQSGSGIRDFRYDYDIGNQTAESFLHFGTSPDQSLEAHDAGTRWAATLWDLNHLLIQKYGFEPNLYNSASLAGNIRAIHLIVNAQMLQPANPSFIEARNAILQADTLLYGGVNHDEIWAAFARRGLGVGAATPSPTSTLLTTSFEVPGLTIAGTIPATNALVAVPPTSFVVNFSGSIAPATISAADLSVNGIPASSVALSNSNQTATFSYGSSPVTAVGVQVMTIAAGAVARDSDGSTNDAFTTTFDFGVVPLQVVSTSPGSPGGVFVLPDPFTFNVNFNQPVDPASVQLTDLVVTGISGASVTNVVLLPGNTTARFTIDGISDEGSLSASIAAGAIRGTFANPISAFSASYAVDIDTDDFPTPLAFNAPQGSLSYDRIESGVINFNGDIDSFTLNLDAAQKITVVLNSNSVTLQPSVQLIDPFGAVLGSAVAAGLDQNALLQTITAAASGTYTLRVGGAGGTTGNYTIQVLLNAAVEAADVGIGTNNTRATAQDLTPAFITRATPQGFASQATVIGRDGASLTLNWADSGWWDSTGAHMTSNKNYLVSRTSHDFFVFNLATVSQPITTAQLRLEVPSGGYNSVDPTETFALFQVATPLAELQATGTGRLDIFNDLADGTSYGSRTYSAADNNTITTIAVNSSGISALNANFGNSFAFGGALTTIVGTGGQAVFSSSGSTTLTKQLVLTLANTDFYSFNLTAGQRTTVGLRNLQGSGTSITIQDANGITLASGLAGAANLDQAISNFAAPATGTYYVVVTASSATATYDLVVTRDAGFDTEANNSYATAQVITTSPRVAGAIAPLPVVPSQLANTNGNSSNGFPFNIASSSTPSMRYQQIYAKSEFNQPGTITALRFRRNNGESAFTTSGIDVKINLSYAATTVDTVSSTFASNVGASLTTVLDTTNLTLSSSGFASTNPFDVVINLTTPFVYDPKQGDLLMDVSMRNSPATRQFDFSSSGEQATTRRVYATNVSNSTGTIDFSSNPTYAGLVTRFDMASDEDWYQFNVTSTTNRLRLETSTAADGGNELVNTLNPRIELYSPTNSVTPLASGTLQADGRNEFIQFQPMTTGLYRVRVTGESGTGGEYFLTAVSDAPRVIATSIAPGALLNPGTLVFQATFSAPMLTSNLSTGDFLLHGNLLNIDHRAEQFTFNDDGTVLTLIYSDLPDDDYSMTLTAGSSGGASFTNLAGNALDGEFASAFPSGNGSAGGNFVFNFSMQPASEAISFVAEEPAGSLIYDPIVARAIVTTSDTDTFSFTVDPGQQISVLVTPNSAGLRLDIQLVDPSGTILGTVTATAAGQSAMLRSIAANSALPGTYKVIVSGASSTIGRYKLRIVLNADLEAGGPLSLGSNKSRATAQDLNPSFLTLPSSLVSPSRAAVIGSVGSMTLNAIDSGWWDNSGAHTASNKNYVAGLESGTTFRDFFVFDLAGVSQSAVAAQLLLMNPFNGYSGDSTETFSLFDVSTPLTTLRANGSGSIGIGVFNDLGSGTIYGSRDFQEGDEGETRPVALNASGLSVVNGALGGQVAFGGSITTISGTAAQEVFAGSGTAGTLLDSRQLVLTVPTDSDYYSFTLQAGQAATVALKNVSGSGVAMSLQNASGATVAISAPGSANLDQVIANFLAPTSETYYIVVTTTSSAATYNIVVTRDVTFETEFNDPSSAAQPLGPSVGVLGAVVSGATVVPSPLANANGNGSNAFPFNLQFTPVATMRYQQIYDHSEFSHPGQITAIRFRRNPDQDPFVTSGIDVKVRLSQAATTVGSVSQMFAENVGAGVTTVYDSATDGLLTLSSSAVGDGPYPFDIVLNLTTPFLYNPDAGDLLLDIFMRNSTATAQFDFSSSGQQSATRRVFATDVDATMGTIDLSSTPGFAGLLTQFDFAPTDDWYSFEVASPAQSVRLETATPADGPNQFSNTLNPHLELYDPSNTLVASGMSMADGRNEFIQYQPLLSGSYRVRVVSEGGTTGEYLLTKNIGPAIVSLAVSSPIDENDLATLIGTIDDTDSHDSHTVFITWGPGESSSTLELPPGVLTFSATHQYLDDNPSLASFNGYPISVTVTDSRGATAASMMTLTVNNAAPVLDALSATSVIENGVAHLTGTYHDVGSQDTHMLTIDWGEGVPETYTVSEGAFGITHQYLDDNPTGTPSDTYTIGVTLTDDDGDSAGGTLTVNVANEVPDHAVLSSGAIDENDSFLLIGSFTDAGTQDTHTVVIDWGDGSMVTTIELVAGVLVFSADHSYLDDNPTGTPADDYTIMVTVTDDDTGSSSGTSSVLVNNVAPQNVNAGVDQTADEGDTVTLAGSFSDPGTSDTHTYSWHVMASNGQSIADGTASTFSFVPSDNGIYSVIFTVTDDDGGSASDTVIVTVNNVAPTARSNSYEVSQAASVVGNVITDDTGNGADSDPAGASDPLSISSHTEPANGTLSIHSDGTFTYTPDNTFSGTDSFAYTVADGDGGSATATVTITVTPAAPGTILIIPDTCLGGTALLITGTAAGDSIYIEPGSSPSTLQVNFNGVLTIVAMPTGRVIVIGGAGNDEIHFAGSIANPAWLFGDAGDDKLDAANGGSLLIGGDGNDDLKGGNGRDLMIGGQGADKLIGNSDDDIIIAGLTTYDGRTSAGHEEFWCHVLAEWNSTSGFTTRVNNLRGLNPSYTGPKLLPEVVDDFFADQIDFLNGSSGNDWLIFLAGEDKVVGQTEAGN